MNSTFKQLTPPKKQVLPKPFNEVNSLLQKGIQLAKCRKCGCMRGTLENLKASLSSLEVKGARELLQNVNEWLQVLEPTEYPCFGCNYCIPPEAMTILTSRYPSIASSTLLSCDFQVSEDSWPSVAGEYTVLDKSAPVAVSTLASTELEEKLVKSRPAGLCIVGKTETENIGIDKIVKNVITNPAIGFLIVAGKDTMGHQSGKTLLSLWENGVDKNMRVIGSTGRRPIHKNVSLSEVNTFRKQIQIDNQIGCESVKLLTKKIEELSQKTMTESLSSCGCHECDDEIIKKPQTLVATPKIKAVKPKSIKLDKAGYFVIIPSRKDKLITVEHYSYDNKLLRTIEGKNSRDIYFTIINNKWITDLAHAAYLGKELSRAELSIKKGFKFIQDGA
jgi:tetrahydromethanopterin S-methyltransferase subunit A